MKQVVIHSDGGCDGNPGPGGWAAVLQYGKVRKEIAGGDPATTNNRMELQAAISALAALREPCEVAFYTDSQYVRQGISQWITRWKAKGWRISANKPLQNADLWRELDSQAGKHKIEWHWVRGHAGAEWNERCDALAAEQISALRRQYTASELNAKLAEFRLIRQHAEPMPAMLL